MRSAIRLLPGRRRRVAPVAASRHPRPDDIVFEIGVTLAAHLAVALAVNLALTLT